MNRPAVLQHAGRLLVELLASNGITRAFCVPGESFLPALDAFFDSAGITMISCRQEGGAAMMAEAYARITGQPAACFVTRGPGVSNAMAGVHVAAQGSTPLLLVVGEIQRGFRDREAWQEIDVRAMFARHVKWVAEVDDATRLEEYVGRAVRTATSGRPGPVVLGIPEDVFYQEVPLLAPRSVEPMEIAASAAQLDQLCERVEQADNPLMIVGGGGWSEAVREDVEGFAQRFGVSLVTSFRREDYVDNLHPNYAGHANLGMNPELARRIRSADLLLAFGTRLGDVATGHYTLVDVPRPKQMLIHVHASAEELGRVYQPDLVICASSSACARALAGRSPRRPVSADRRRAVEAAHRDYLAWSEPGTETRGRALADSVAWLSRELPPASTITNGAGNFSIWVHRFFRYRRFGAQLAPTSGSMGYGLPAAIAARLAYPDRDVVCFAGDGGLLMTGQELATLAHYGLKIIVVVVNNGTYGSIRMHQERHYPGRRSGTDLTNPDFVAFARAFGFSGCRVESFAEFQAAFEAARRGESSAVIEMVMSADVLKP